MKALPLVLFLLAGCLPARPCIEPPPASSQEQRDVILKLSATFAAIPVSPSVETDFKNAVNTTYAALSDDNTSYWIALQAAMCFSKEGKWGQEVATRILLDLEEQWKARTGQKAAPAPPPK